MAKVTLRRAATVAALAATAAIATPAAADLARITDRDTFVSTVQGREITRLGINLQVTPDGAIRGRALGFDVTGNWSWDNGYFCRTMNAEGREVGYNCQMVSLNGDRIRFQSDRGAGDYADFRLR